MRMKRSARSVGVLLALCALVASGVLVTQPTLHRSSAGPHEGDGPGIQGRICDRAIQRISQRTQDVRRQLDALKAKVKERREMREILGAVDDLARAAYTSEASTPRCRCS